MITHPTEWSGGARGARHSPEYMDLTVNRQWCTLSHPRISLLGPVPPSGWGSRHRPLGTQQGSPRRPRACTAWCGTLSDNCDCHGAKCRLDYACDSEFRLHDKMDKQVSRSQNVRHLSYRRRVLLAAIGYDDRRGPKESNARRKISATYPPTS